MRALLLALLAAGMLVMPAAVASAQTGVPAGAIGIRLVDAPVDRAEDPRASLYIIDHVGPGSSFSRRVEVINGTGEDQAIGIDVVAAELRGGEFVLRDDVTTPLLDWIQTDVSELAVPDGEAGRVVVDFDVPEGASEGEYYAAVMASVTRPSETGVGIVSRVGVRVYLSVGVGGEPAANFSIVDMTAFRDSEGTPGLAISVENTGGRALDIVGEVALGDGPGGTAAGPFDVGVGPTLAPGQTADVRVLLSPDLPSGPWTARATLSSGLLTRAAEAVITFPETPGASASPVEAVPLLKDRGFLVPLATGLLLLVIILLALVLWRARRREETELAG